MSDIDLTQLTEAIQNAITSGFNRVAAEINAGGGLGGGSGAGGTGGGGPPGGGGGAATPTSPQANAQAAALPEVPDASDPEVTGIGETIATGVVNGAAKVLKVADIIFEDAIKKQQSFGFAQTANLIRDFGPQIRQVTQEAFNAGDFSAMFNEGEKAAAASVRSMLNYAAELHQYEGLDLDEIARARRDIIEGFGDANVNLLQQHNAAMVKESIRFSNAMNISASETADLIAVSFAETGEASGDILTEITNQASTVGNAVGVPVKVMAQGIKEVKKDMDTFTDMTVEGAARMIASLSQLGMSIGTFKNLMQPFRDFDSAATKMGDLSAMFGVQMDAMEMMYLANEDEEQFLHKMREQLLDQGLDVESMSKTRQRALADQLGMGVREMKMFMATGQQFADQSDLQAASQEGATRTQAEAMETLNSSMIIATRSLEDMQAASQNLVAAFSGPSLINHTENLGSLQNKMLEATTNTTGLSRAVVEHQQKLNEMMASSSEFIGQIAEGGIDSLEGTNEKLLTAAEEGIAGMTEMYGNIGPLSAQSADASIQNSDIMAQSWPKAFWHIARSFADTSVPGGAEMKVFYENSIKSWGEIFSTSVSSAIEDINNSASFEEMVLKFKEASAEIKDISQNIDTSISAVSSGNFEIANQGSVTVEIEANNLASNLTEAVKEAFSELEKDPVAVNVSVDIDAIKSDLIETIKEGFKDIEYSFDMSIDRQKLATIIAESVVSGGRTFQMRGE